MCVLNGYRPMVDKTLEEIYKGCWTKTVKLIQETQQDAESGIRIGCFG